MRPVLFAVFVIFAVCVSAANVPDNRSKRGISTTIAKATAKYGPIVSKVARLGKVVNKIGLVITIVQTGWEIFQSIRANMDTILTERKIMEIAETAQEITNATITLINPQEPVERWTAMAKLAKYAKQLLASLGLDDGSRKKRDASEFSDMDPKIGKLFDDIEQLVEQIVETIEKQPSTASADFKTELTNLLVHMDDYIKRIDIENESNELNDEKITVFLEEMKNKLTQMSAELH